MACMIKTHPRLLAGAIAVALSQAALASAIDPTENVVLQWNDAALEAIRITHPGPPIVARALAVVNTCTFDAWAAYDDKARGTRYGNKLKAPKAERTVLNKEEAVAYAAYRALSDLFPSEQILFDDLLIAQGYNPGNTAANNTTPSGIGNLACGAVLAFRHQDKSNQLGNINGGAPYSDWTGYQPVNTPDEIFDANHWQPLRVSDGHGGFVEQRFITPHWGRVVGYSLSDWERQVLQPVQRELKRDFGRVGPYDKNDPGYEDQAREVLAYSALLTDQQKVVAEYWADGPSSELPPGHWNLFAQEVSARDQHGLDDDVKMLFSMSNAVFDASIAVWGAKRAFDYVRPVSAIHHLFAGQDVVAWAGPGLGTEAIDGADWRPYQAATVVTPPFAEYPSGHSGFSASAAETLRLFTGSDVFGHAVTIPAGQSFVEPGLVPATDLTLSWATFTDAADEAGISRRYGGIHFKDGDIDARLMGRLIGQLAWERSRYHFGEVNGRPGGIPNLLAP